MRARARLGARSRLEHCLAALGEAVSKINHDLRNMLSSAVLVSDRLEQSDDPEIRKSGERLFLVLDRATRLCQATLDFVRTKPVTPTRRIFVLRDLVAEATAILSSSSPPVHVDNRINERISLYADRDQLYRALSNLVRNAQMAMPEGGRLGFSAARIRRGELVIKVTDTGSGIPEKIRQRLFEPFAVTAAPNGSGLGLAICREIMRGHGGEIFLGSTGPEGTTFELRLPARAVERRKK